MHSTVHQWAADWGVPAHAVVDLMSRMGMGYEPQRFTELEGWSESAIQSRVRLEAAKNDILPWRNNVGALQDESGRVVRYGLCNDTKELNEKVKSSDLIGIKKTWITPEMVGTYLGQFWAREIKPDGWAFTGEGREAAQAKFGQIVTAWGGDFKFSTGGI